MVLDRNSWYNNTNHIMGYHENAGKSNHRRGGPLNEIGVSIQIFQIAYVMITAIIIVMERRGHDREKQNVKG